jgi:hypothetical protein
VTPPGRIWPVVAVLVIVGCGGGSDSGSGSRDGKSSATATATASASATATSGGGGGGKVKFDVKDVSAARYRIAAACKKLDATPKDQAALRALRKAAAVYMTAFKAAPDAKFRRGDKGPEITMRRLLLATSGYVRARCGGGKARALGTRLRRAAAAHS